LSVRSHCTGILSFFAAGASPPGFRFTQGAVIIRADLMLWRDA
jgi:hypothetical protein